MQIVCGKVASDRMAFQVRVTSNTAGNLSETYNIALERLAALVKIVCKNDSVFVVRLIERPEAKVHIDNTNPNSNADVCSSSMICAFVFSLWLLFACL